MRGSCALPGLEPDPSRSEQVTYRRVSMDMRWLFLSAWVLISACTSVVPIPAPAPTAAVPIIAPSTVGVVALGNGLAIDVPLSWQIAEGGIVNRGIQRLLMVGNGDLASLPTIPGNGDVDPTTLPSGRVVVEIEVFCRLACRGPETETALPLDWSTAAPLYDRALPVGRHEMAVAFRWFGQPIYIVARWADDAPAADITAIPSIVRSVRADPLPPTTGLYGDWLGLGMLTDLPIGTVRTVPFPVGGRPSSQPEASAPFFVVRGRVHTLAFIARSYVGLNCELRYDGDAGQFTCVDDPSIRWSHFGTWLGARLVARNLVQHPVLIRDGAIWVNYISSTLSEPTVPDEAAER